MYASISMYEIIQFKNYDNKNIIPLKKLKFNTHKIIDIYLLPIKTPIRDIFKIKKRNVYINYIDYLNDINTTNDIKKLKYQFILDIKRSYCICNRYEIDDANMLYDYLDYKYNNKIMKEILVFCSQAVFSIPFKIIQNSIFEFNENYFLCQQNNNSIKLIIEANDNGIILYLTKKLQIIDVQYMTIQYFVVISLMTHIPKINNDDVVSIEFKINKS